MGKKVLFAGGHLGFCAAWTDAATVAAWNSAAGGTMLFMDLTG